MALDAEHRRAFLVCEDNNLMAVIDLEKHRVVTTLPIADGGDVIKYDPGSQTDLRGLLQRGHLGFSGRRS